MTKENYIYDIDEEGSKGIGILDHLFNKSTQEFLTNAGLKRGMNVLDIGCGSGLMSMWMAKQVGSDGLVVGIENNSNQLAAAKQNAADRKVKNIAFKLCSTYELDKLKQTFDFVYCRFVLHHLNNPQKAIEEIFNVLNPRGIYASEEGIVNFAFTYPYSSAWGSESASLPPIWSDASNEERDGNIGVKMPTNLMRAGFNIANTKIIHPVMTSRDEKKLLLLGMDERKNFFLSQGNTENDWDTFIDATKSIIDNDEQIAGFYASLQVAGMK